jgi:hypothetical protein
MVHQARVDKWLTVLLGGLAVVECAAAGALLVAGFTKGAAAPAVTASLGLVPLGGGVILCLLLWGCHRTRYEITPSHLVTSFGPFGSSLPLENIFEVFPSRSLVSAHAPSLDRLRINYYRKDGKAWFALVSPCDKATFVRDLASAAPQLRSAGEASLKLSKNTAA